MQAALITLTIVAALVLAGCAGPAKVAFSEPCGVITDSLSDVNARSRKGQQRLVIHYERGIAAKCWTR